MNLKNLFTAIGQTFQKELKDNIKGQSDINGSRFSLIKPSTAKARASKIGAQKSRASIGNKGIVPRTGKVRKSAATSVPMTRLFFTERFWKDAFKFTAHNESVEVFVNRGSYPVRAGESPIKFAEIVHYNNQGNPSVNKNITSPPLIFPNDMADVKKMSAWTQAEDRFRASVNNGEIYRAIAQQGLKDMTVELNINL